MNPQSLSVAQPIVLRLDLDKHNLAAIPQKQIRQPTDALPVFLRQHFAYCGQGSTETVCYLDQIVPFKGPVDANGACLSR